MILKKCSKGEKGSRDYYKIGRLKKNYDNYDNVRNEVIKHFIAVIKDINYPNILQLIVFKEDSEYYYGIYEYCNGGALFSH